MRQRRLHCFLRVSKRHGQARRDKASARAAATSGFGAHHLPRRVHNTKAHARNRGGLPLSLSPMREGVCVCMSIDCARMVHVVEGVVRGGVAGCKCAPPPRQSARHVAPSAPPGARANSRPQRIFGAAQKGWRSTRQSTCGCQ